MATLASTIIDKVELLLMDSDNVHWVATEHLANLNEGQREVVKEKPDANPVRESVLLSAGIWQSLPSGGILLLDATMNMGLTPATSDTLLKIPYASLGAELITNGTMEADANWANAGTPPTNERSTTQKYAGSYSRKFICNADDEGIQGAVFTTSTSGLYRYQAWVYPSVTSVKLNIRKGDNSGNIVTSTNTVVASAWNLISGYYAETSGGAGAYAQVLAADGATVYVDNVSVKAVTLPFSEVLFSADYSTPGAPITLVDRKWMDTALPGWTTETAATAIKHVIYDPKTNPKKFMVYPPSDGAGYIEIVTAKAPTDVAAVGNNLTVEDEYADALIDYMLFRAYSKDADYAISAERAIKHYSIFLARLGKLDAMEAALNPKKGQGAD